MVRPQTENLDAFSVAPQPWTPQGLPTGVTIRVLNRDDETGGVSAVVEWPAGWRWHGPGYCEADQELFVLDGRMKIGGQVLASGCFSYFPKGVLQAGWEVIEPCRAFAMFDLEPRYRLADQSTTEARTEHTVACLDSWAMDWENPLDASAPSDSFRPGIFVKVLRQCPDTGASTHLAGLMPGWYAEGIEVHPVREESLVISGDVNIGQVNGEPGYTVGVGGYYSRPAGIPHGPLSSKNGNVGLVHSDGLLGIDYQSNPRARELIMSHLHQYPWR